MAAILNSNRDPRSTAYEIPRRYARNGDWILSAAVAMGCHTMDIVSALDSVALRAQEQEERERLLETIKHSRLVQQPKPRRKPHPHHDWRDGDRFTGRRR